MTDAVREILRKKGYGYVQTNVEQAEIWLRKGDEQARAVMFLQQTRQVFAPETVKNLHFQIERKLYLQGIRDVQVLVCILTGNPDENRAVTQLGIPVWLIDLKQKRIMIFENQPDDFDGLLAPLEDTLFPQTTEDSRMHGASLPFVTIAFVLANLLVFFFLERSGSTENVSYMLRNGASEWHLVFEEGQYWRLFTCMFLHFGISHLGNNMLVLALAGSQLEQKIGHIRFMSLYLISGLCASLASALWFMVTDDAAVSAGASGAIYGVLGAMVVMTLKERKNLGNGIVRRCAWMVFLLIYGSVTQPQVDFVAHIAGMLAGAVISIPQWSRPRRLLQRNRDGRT